MSPRSGEAEPKIAQVNIATAKNGFLMDRFPSARKASFSTSTDHAEVWLVDRQADRQVEGLQIVDTPVMCVQHLL